MLQLNPDVHTTINSLVRLLVKHEILSVNNVWQSNNTFYNAWLVQACIYQHTHFTHQSMTNRCTVYLERLGVRVCMCGDGWGLVRGSNCFCEKSANTE